MAAVIQFITDHSAVLASFAVAVLDLVFALNQKAASNGLLHWVYLLVKKDTVVPPPSP